MKRPKLKRKEKPSPLPASPSDPLPQKERRFKPKTKSATPLLPQKERRFKPKKKAATPQEQAAAASAQAPAKKTARAGRGIGAPARIVRKPLSMLGGLSGRPRIVVWGLLAVVLLLGALALRGGRDDDALVRQALERYEKASADKDYQMLCDELLASSYVKQTASSGLPCEVALRTALEDVKNPTLEVIGVEVNGDRAAANVRGSAAGQVPGTAVYTLVREDDAWRILPPRSGNAPP